MAGLGQAVRALHHRGAPVSGATTTNRLEAQRRPRRQAGISEPVSTVSQARPNDTTASWRVPGTPHGRGYGRIAHPEADALTLVRRQCLCGVVIHRLAVDKPLADGQQPDVRSILEAPLRQPAAHAAGDDRGMVVDGDRVVRRYEIDEIVRRALEFRDDVIGGERVRAAGDRDDQRIGVVERLSSHSQSREAKTFERLSITSAAIHAADYAWPRDSALPVKTTRPAGGRRAACTQGEIKPRRALRARLRRA